MSRLVCRRVSARAARTLRAIAARTRRAGARPHNAMASLSPMSALAQEVELRGLELYRLAYPLAERTMQRIASS